MNASSPRPFPVAVLGLNPRGWHWLERLSLRDDVAIAGAWDADPHSRRLANEQGWRTFDSVEALLHVASPAGVIIAADRSVRADLAQQALDAGCHILTEPPVAETADAARTLYARAAQRGLCCWAATPRRWDEDVIAAKSVVQAGRLGLLSSLRLIINDWSPWAYQGDQVQAGEPSTMELLMVPVLDQLGEITSAEATNVWVQPLRQQDGLIAVLTLSDGATVQLDLRRRSLVPQQTGWLLHGDRGSYHNRRLYTLTAEGEIIDEPVQYEIADRDPLLNEWMRRCTAKHPHNENARALQLTSLCETLQKRLNT